MKEQLKKYSEIALLAILFYISDRFYTIFLGINWAVDTWQRKRGYKDMGERKYDKEQFIIMAIMIPEATKLTGPEIKKVFKDELSKDHIYKIIEYRKELNKNHKNGMQYIRSTYLRNMFPEDYS